MSGKLIPAVVVGAVLVGLSVAGPLTPSASAVPSASERHCSVAVLGQQADGELITTPETCTTGPSGMSILSTTIAVHYTNANWTGSSFTVLGNGCTGGWLNLPSDWVNVISSTSSSCTVSHYDFFYLGGTNEVLFGSGNLTYMNDRTNSVQYS